MNSFFDDTVTLYNHHAGKWYRTVLEGVQWVSKTTKTVDSDGKMHVIPEISLTVPYREGYVKPKDYEGKDFTFGFNNLDVIVLGNCPREITESYTITSLRKEFDDVATIYAAKDNTLRPLLKHWKVMAK